MATLTRDQILGALHFRSEVINIPELGGGVRVRDMGCHRRDQLAEFIAGFPNPEAFVRNLGKYRLFMLCNTVCDDEGNLLFTQDDMERLENSFSYSTLEPLFAAALRVNNMSKGAPEEAVKKSQPPTDASGTALPATLAEPSGS